MKAIQMVVYCMYSFKATNKIFININYYLLLYSYLFFIRCLEKYNNLKFDISNSNFEGNKGVNGGVLYFGDNENNNGLYDLHLRNTSFVDNMSTYFGGVIYSKFNHLYTLHLEIINFINNYAGVAGGALFSPNLPDYNLFDYQQCQFDENKAESHGNDYATHPSLVELLDKNKYNNVIIKSGSYLPMKFSIFDSFNNTIKDPNKYYSDISIKALINKINNNTVNINNKNNDFKYILQGNVGSFVNGKNLYIISKNILNLVCIFFLKYIYIYIYIIYY